MMKIRMGVLSNLLILALEIHYLLNCALFVSSAMNKEIMSLLPLASMFFTGIVSWNGSY